MGCVLRRGVVVILLACVSACAAKGGTPRPFPAPPSVAVPPEITAPAAVSPSGAFSIQSLLDTALGYRGVPYRNGGSDPTGFDCSGFVQWVFAQHGIRLPREVRDQYQYGSSIDRDDVKAGDLVFFETVSRGASHVGNAVGADHSSTRPALAEWSGSRATPSSIGRVDTSARVGCREAMLSCADPARKTGLMRGYAA